MVTQINDSRDPRLDLGLLFLRLIALFLLATVGWEKVHDLAVAVRSGKPLASTGLAPLINKLGFPLPVFCYLYVVFNESLSALLITLGLFTRAAAFCAALSMTGAFYTALHFGWEPLRAFIYLFVFVAIAFTGAGRFSLDSRFVKWQAINASSDAGLLVLRLGLLSYFGMLFLLKVNAARSFSLGPSLMLVILGAILAGPAIVGCFTRQVSIISSALWAWGAVSGLLAGQKWDIFPYRDVMLFMVFIVLALSGPGRYSLSYRRNRLH